MQWTIHLEGGPRRVNHSAVAVGDKIYSFGGYCTGEEYRVYKPIDVHMLNTESLRWKLLTPKNCCLSSVPFQRYGHTVVAYHEMIYLWGGRNDEGSCNALYCYDTNTKQWSRPAVKGILPGARDGHSACVINNCMYIFGGYEEEIDQFSQEVHCLNFENMTWQFIKTWGEPPRWRDFHSASIIGRNMYIFGGRGDGEGPFHSQDEIYCNKIAYLDTKSMIWVHPDTKGIVPMGRRSHSAFVFKDKLYIFGGYNGLSDKHFGDIFRYDPDTSTWTLLSITGNGPCPRRRQCCCVVGNKVFLFGGTSPNPDYNHYPLQDFFSTEGIDLRLMDHADLHVLDFFPALKTLCLLTVIKLGLDQKYLPKELRCEIACMTQNNNISRPLPNSG